MITEKEAKLILIRFQEWQLNNNILTDSQGRLAGSVLDMKTAVHNYVEMLGLTRSRASNMASSKSPRARRICNVCPLRIPCGSSPSTPRRDAEYPAQIE